MPPNQQLAPATRGFCPQHSGLPSAAPSTVLVQPPRHTQRLRVPAVSQPGLVMKVLQQLQGQRGPFRGVISDLRVAAAVG